MIEFDIKRLMQVMYQFLELSKFLRRLTEARLVEFQPPQADHVANTFREVSILLTEEQQQQMLDIRSDSDESTQPTNVFPNLKTSFKC